MKFQVAKKNFYILCSVTDISRKRNAEIMASWLFYLIIFFSITEKINVKIKQN